MYVDSNGRGLIKGNINAKGEKIYHIPNKGSYNSTQINTSAGERWFKTEREVQNAEWRKADNIK
ncbi:hypothetical protein [Miniphocaeibacter halophilus]|uniref:Uncharacterized protein n=1 Tax=Miniphocaeibacter halophilus TaxID=2931922 RepID=A0AC61MPJ1_9FIRM|nr:hypothetical protein [Miniphocaeibacter halophilus]QQK07462.1 hypothetical protein JFY71_09105 [Miniphocaeibacter halophilus]